MDGSAGRSSADYRQKEERSEPKIGLSPRDDGTASDDGREDSLFVRHRVSQRYHSVVEWIVCIGHIWESLTHILAAGGGGAKLFHLFSFHLFSCAGPEERYFGWVSRQV